MTSAHAEQLAARLKEARTHLSDAWASYFAARRARRPLSELDALADRLIAAHDAFRTISRDLESQKRRDELNSTTISKFQSEKSSARS